MVKRDPSEMSEVVRARDRLRGAGLRATPARMATLTALETTSTPLTHAEVADRIDHVGADKATVLRNLADMVSVGLIRRTELGDRLWRYEAIDPERPHAAHPHFVCIDCGTVACLEELNLSAKNLGQTATVGEVTEVLFKGHCANCLESCISGRRSVCDASW